MKNKLAELPKTNATVFPIMRATQTATDHNQESTKHKAKKQCRSDTESKLEKNFPRCFVLFQCIAPPTLLLPFLLFLPVQPLFPARVCAHA